MDKDIRPVGNVRSILWRRDDDTVLYEGMQRIPAVTEALVVSSESSKHSYIINNMIMIIIIKTI